MPRQLNVLLAALVLCAAIACGGSDPKGATQESVFINVMVELRRIGTDTSLDSAALDSARGAVLRRHGLTVGGLEEMARELASDPQRALDEWREIERLSQGERLLIPRRERPPTAP